MADGKCHRCGGTGREPDWRGIGLRARRERESRCVSLRQMAKRVGVSPAYLSDLECANRSWQGPKARAYLKLLGLAAPTEGDET
ncbi:hypothetical protein LCGC14_1746850 [marine sediment metagenome]|uniref:HTH cro/C1-type domain-containing protein n=1 Tax=marine sediment metagenome TaxID=412755 RepID=A0A0F9H4Z9_9ZZZZ